MEKKVTRLTRKNKTNEKEPKDIYLVSEKTNDFSGNNQHLANQKLGQLEDIEDELDIDLLLLSKVFTNGFSYKNEKEEIIVIKPNDLFLTCLVIQPLCKRLFCGGFR